MSWQINPDTGDYVMTKGNPTDLSTLKIPAYYRLKVQRGKWLYAPDDQYGSDFYLVKKRFNGGDLGGLSDIGERALEPMIDDGRAARVQVDYDPTQQQSRNNTKLNVYIQDAQGNVETLSLPPVGA